MLSQITMGESLNCDGSIGGLPNVIAVVIHGCVIKCASHYRAFPTYNENKNFSKKSIFPSI
jgi:hypothetical protein